MGDPIAIAPVNFRFECQPGCVNCCERPGEVYLTQEDLVRISAYLELSVEEFSEHYCEPDEEEGLRLSHPVAASCHFLIADGCRIHTVKPLQCKSFPFWPETISTRKAWKNLRGYCPGVGVGEILPIEYVRAEAQKCADAFPD